MPTHDEQPENEPRPEEIDVAKGYEATDVRPSGIVVFLVALAIFVGVAGALAYGIGKAINAHLAKEDGPRSKWAQTADVRQLGNMPNSPELQNKMAELTENFPTPRVQTDDGSQDVADLHVREDLLLDHYTWADANHTKIRIPVELAMELVAKSGLPVAPAAAEAPLMTGDAKPTIAVPLTTGFARTGYEYEQAQVQKVEAGRAH